MAFRREASWYVWWGWFVQGGSGGGGGAKARAGGAGEPVKKTFRAFVPDQVLLLPPSLDEWLPEDHLARFVAELSAPV